MKNWYRLFMCMMVLVFTSVSFAGYTSDLTGTGNVSASTTYAGSASNTTDNNSSTVWSGNTILGTEWLKVQFPSAKTIAQYTITTSSNSQYRPDDWKFQGSNDNSAWTDLDTPSNEALAVSTKYTYNGFTTGSYIYYRFLFSDAITGNYVDVAEIEMMEWVAPAQPQITFTDGASFNAGGLAYSSTDNKIGEFTLSATIAGATFTSVNISLTGDIAYLANLILKTGGSQLGSTASSASSINFSRFSSGINTGGGTLYELYADNNYAGGAGSKTVRALITSNDAIVISGGEFASSFTNGYLSSTDISLPVELAEFSAVPENGAITVSWATESEVQNLGFILQRITGPVSRSNPKEWETIATYQTHSELKGTGNSSSRTEYSVIDVDVEPGKTYYYQLSDVDTDGEITKDDVIIITLAQLPETTELEAPYPNPFNPVTKIAYQLANDANVTLSVINTMGQTIRTIIRNESTTAGSYSIHWNGQNDAGMNVPSGIYFLVMKTDNFVQTQKAMLVR